MTQVNQDIGVAAPFMQGDSLTIEVPVFQADGTTPQSITGTSIRWEAFLSVGGVPVGQPLISKGVGTGITITNGPGGIFEVAILPADTLALYGTYYHEAEVTFVGGVVSTVLTGRFVIQRAGIQPAA